MFKQALSVILGCQLLAVATAQAQTNDTTGDFELLIEPPANTIFVESTTNLLALTISNIVVTNAEETNYLFSNIVVSARTSTTNVAMNDQGQQPDDTPDDGKYQGAFIAPETEFAETITMIFTITATDLTLTNANGEIEPGPVTNRIQRPYIVVSRPGNDDFVDGYKIKESSTIVTSTNNYASLEPGEPQHADASSADASVWWVWSSSQPTNVLVDLAGTDFDSVLAVYQGSSVTQLTEVASSTYDDIKGIPPHVNFDTELGGTYRIAVAGNGAGSNFVGNIRLRIAPGATPDDRPPLTTINSPERETLITSSNIVISGFAKEATPMDSGVSNVLIRINGGAPIPASGGENWYAFLGLPPGTNVVEAYAVDYAGNEGKPDAVVVRYVNPINDDFAESIFLDNVGGYITAINGRATKEPGEPIHGGNQGGHSIWYSWRAPANGTLNLTTSGSDFDTLMGLYIGTNITNLITLGSNDDSYAGSGYSQITYSVISNQLYHIAIDGFAGESGNIMFQYSFTPPEPGQYYSLDLGASAGGKVHPGSGLYKAGAQVTVTAVPDTNFVFDTWEGDISQSINPLSISVNSDISITAKFKVDSTLVTDDFESGDLKKISWASEGTPWQAQTNAVANGAFAAGTGDITNNATSSLVLVTNTAAGVGWFDFRVSTEENWDTLEFYLNSKLLMSWSGDQPWENFFFEMPSGENRFEWRYSKDGSFSGGDDAVYIDNVFIPIVQLMPEAPTLILLRQEGGVTQITLQGEPNQEYELQVSSDLEFWSTLDSGSSPSGIVHFQDPEAARHPIRFYRATAE
ncbi:MAG: hypothetical protein K9N48_04135 [Verrucomicrobia bacterium]|nr:hypothetical protein [Verrucomicrobiota bacterium]